MSSLSVRSENSFFESRTFSKKSQTHEKSNIVKIALFALGAVALCFVIRNVYQEPQLQQNYGQAKAEFTEMDFNGNEPFFQVQGSSPVWDSIKEGIKGTVYDTEKIKAIRSAQVNGEIEAPSHLERQLQQGIDTLKKEGTQIPSFFEIWKKILDRKEISAEEIHLLPLEEQNILYSILFQYDFYRHIHQPPQKPIAATAYAVNLLWLEKSQGSRLSSKELVGKFKASVDAWAQVNSSKINIWYHGQLSSKDAVEALKSSFSKQKVRDLSEIDLNPYGFGSQFFTNPKIYHYLKIDTAKALILDHTLRVKKEVKYSVYADLDPTISLPKDELFDEQTLQTLKQSGFIMALPGYGGPTDGYENGFMIFDRDNVNLLNNHQKLLKNTVTTQINRLNEYLRVGKAPSKKEKDAMIQGVYSMYLGLSNMEAVTRLFEEHIKSGDSSEAWRDKSEKFKQTAPMPPAKPISSTPTRFTWN